MRLFVTAVTVFAASSFALPLGSIVPADAKEYVLSVTSEDGSVKGEISQKNGHLGVFPGSLPARFFTTTYEPSQTLAFHIGDLSNQIILVGSNGLLDIDDLTNPSTDTIPKGKLAEWSTFTIAANGTLGVKDGSDIPSRRWIAYPSNGGYVISLYDGYTKNNAKMTTVQVSAKDAASTPALPVPAPALPPASQRPSPKSSPGPAQPRPQPSTRPQSVPRPGSPYPRVQPGGQQPSNGSPSPRVQPGPGNLQPYAPTFGGGPSAPNGYVPYNPDAAPSWQAPPPVPAAPAPVLPLPVQDPNAPVLYPSADGPASSPGPAPSAGGAPTIPLQAPTTTIAQPALPWWDPFGLFSGNKANTATTSPSTTVAAPSNAGADYQPAGGVSGPAPTASSGPISGPVPDLISGITNGIGSLLGLGSNTDSSDSGDDFSL